MKRARKPRPLTLLQKRTFLAAIPVPPGMLASFHDEQQDRWNTKAQKTLPEPVPTAIFAGDGVTIRIEMNGNGDYMHGCGHTNFTTCHGERTYDRTGVDDSFYVHAAWLKTPAETPEQVGATLLEQLARVAKSREHAKQSVIVPGLGYSVTPEQRAKYTADLIAGHAVRFTPSGFGTGYSLTILRRSRWDKAAKPETAAFFGVRALFIETLDCD
jgi:hypothetical protein